MASKTAAADSEVQTTSLEVQVLDYFRTYERTSVITDSDMRPCRVTRRGPTGEVTSSTTPVMVDLKGRGPESAAARRYMFHRRPA